jgi:LPS-assembly lipoprotein
MLKLRNTVAFSAPDTIAGFAIRSRLIDRLGLATTPIATLSVNVEQALDVASQSQSGSTLRYNVVGAAGWQLTAANGTVWGSGQVEGFTSYAATGSTVATQSAATDAVGRLMTILADKVVTQLMLLDLPQ